MRRAAMIFMRLGFLIVVVEALIDAWRGVSTFNFAVLAVACVGGLVVVLLD